MNSVLITFRDEHQKFLEEAVKSGRYVSESEVVADALSELKARDRVREARLGELRAEIQIGLEQLDRGECEEWNVEAFIEETRAIRDRNTTA